MEEETSTNAEKAPQRHITSRMLRRLPVGVWTLGFVSMFMDISSELVHSLLPVFLVSVLGASMTAVGVVEGTAEAVASITKVFSGIVSDLLRKRKLLAVIGYGLAAMTKPIFPLATSVSWVFMARFIDRIGKGIRGTPRDALVADISPPESRGAAFGLRQSLDSAGAFLGPLLAVALMALFMNDIKMVLWLAVAPAFLAVLLLVVGVKEPDHPEHHDVRRLNISIGTLRLLPPRYWAVVALGTVFSLARFSEAFILLRGQDVGLAIGYVPVVMIVMNVVCSGIAYPAGLVADRLGSRGMLAGGLVALIAADVVLAIANRPLQVMVGAGLWGLHLGLTQGLLSKLVADAASQELRGTAFGIFNLAGGVALLLASVIAGVLWNLFGAPATFITGAAFGCLAIVGLLISYRIRRA